MLVDSPEMLKAWLAHVLDPLCDADPAALAKYVLALVKKDKQESELRQSMIEQLEVFLQSDTKHFVDTLFQSLESKSYLLYKEESETTPTPPPPPTISPVVNSNAASANGAVATSEPTSPTNKKEEKKKIIVTEEKDEHRPRSKPPRSPIRVRSRSRSRSWDRTLRRSRSRERSIKGRKWERRKSPPVRRYRRSWSRSRSPLPPRGRSPPPRRIPRIQRSWSRSPPPPSGVARSRSPPPAPRSRTRSRSPVSKPFSRTTEGSRSPRSKSRERSADKPDPAGSLTPTQDSNHGDVDMRLGTTSQSIRSVVNSTAPPPPVETEAPSTTYNSRQRCRDYDEKGLCLRGDLCPFDHGSDPVVVDDPSYNVFPPQQQTTSYAPGGGRGKTHVPMGEDGEYNPADPGLVPRLPWPRPHYRGRGGGRGNHSPHQHHSQHGPPPLPLQSGGQGPPYVGGGGGGGGQQQTQRELINVPLGNNEKKDGSPQRSMGMGQMQSTFKRRGLDIPYDPPMKKRGTFDFNRLGPRNKPYHCSLELRKVPTGLNTIANLNKHFERFGKITNIQVNYDSDPEGALVSFSNHAEANAAYRCTEAVLNNRFIKLFWHNKENTMQDNTNVVNAQQQQAPVQQSQNMVYEPNNSFVKPSIKERLSLPSPMKDEQGEDVEGDQSEKVLVSSNNVTKTVYNAAALKIKVAKVQDKAEVIAAVMKNQEMLAVRQSLMKKQEEKRKAALTLQKDLSVRKGKMLKEHLTQQKKLLERLNTTTKPEEKKQLMELLKNLQEASQTIKEELTKNKMKTPEETEREILDAELDLYTRQQEGGDTVELVKRVTELKLKAKAMGINVQGRGRGRGGRAGRRGRGGMTRGARSYVAGGQSTILDRRPSKLLVSGFESDEEVEVLRHFGQFGTIVNHLLEKKTPSIVINYKTRKEAELAMLKGKSFNDRDLSIVWYSDPSLNLVTHGISNDVTGTGRMRKLSVASQSGERKEGENEEEEEVNLNFDLNDDELLQDDEEEEDTEGRSWRR